MLNSRLNSLIVSALIFISVLINGILSALVNKEFFTNTVTYIDIYITAFSFKGAFLPIIILFGPPLSMLYNKNPDKVIKWCFFTSIITYFVYFLLFNHYFLIKTIMLLIGCSISFINIFFLSQKLINIVTKPLFAIFFICACQLIILNSMMFSDHIFKAVIFTNSRVTTLFIGLVFCVMFILYGQVFSSKKTTQKKITIKIFRRYFIYLINFFKNLKVLNLSVIFFLNGILLGLISQFISHYVSEFNYNNLESILVFQLISYSAFLVLLTTIGMLVNKKHIPYINSGLAIFLMLLLINIIVVIFDSQSSILNKLLIINCTWLCMYIFMTLLIDYFHSFKTHRFALMMIVGYILYFFGITIARWADIVFIDIKVSLYLSVIVICLIAFFQIKSLQDHVFQ
jgi:hypothetical protein